MINIIKHILFIIGILFFGIITIILSQLTLMFMAPQVIISALITTTLILFYKKFIDTNKYLKSSKTEKNNFLSKHFKISINNINKEEKK